MTISIHKNALVDIHYDQEDAKKAERIAKSYEYRGYTRECEDQYGIQLLRTTINDLK